MSETSEDSKKVPTEPAKPTAEEMEAELQGRVKSFNAELIPVLKKYRLGLGAVPFVQPDGTLAARAIVLNDPQAKEVAPEKKLEDPSK